MSTPRHLRVLPVSTTSTMLVMVMMLMAGCGRDVTVPPTAPTPQPPAPPSPPTLVTANAYILPDAVRQGDWAFGDEPIVINKGERLRWVNVDALSHIIVADAPDATDFRKTDELPSGGEQSFIMNKLGTTRIHCSIHPNMTGTLIVRER